MKSEIVIKGAPAKKGTRITKGRWLIADVKGRPRIFPGTLIATFNKGDVRIAIFSVPK